MNRTVRPAALAITVAVLVAACSSGESAPHVRRGRKRRHRTAGDRNGGRGGARRARRRMTPMTPDETDTTERGARGDGTGRRPSPHRRRPRPRSPSTRRARSMRSTAPTARWRSTSGTGWPTSSKMHCRERTEAYNSSQDRVRVRLQNQTSYEDAIEKYIQLGQRNRPHLIQLPEYVVQPMAESDTYIPVEACIEAAWFRHRAVPRTVPSRPGSSRGFSGACRSTSAHRSCTTTG